MIMRLTQSVGFNPAQKTTRQRPGSNPLQRDTVQFSGKKPSIKFGMRNPLVEAAVQANDDQTLQAALAKIDNPEEKRSQANSAYSELLFNQAEPNPKAIEVVLDAGVDVNEKNAAGDTALHTLSLKSKDNVPVWQLLLDRGIAVNEHDDNKRTAWHYVMQRSKQNSEIVAMLMHSGARIESHAQLSKALTTLEQHPEFEKRSELLSHALQNGLNIESNDHVVEVLFSKLKTRPDLMVKVLQGGFIRLQSKDTPFKSIKDRLADPNNVSVFSKHLGEEQAATYIQAVLDAAMTV